MYTVSLSSLAAGTAVEAKGIKAECQRGGSKEVEVVTWRQGDEGSLDYNYWSVELVVFTTCIPHDLSHSS